MTCEVGHLPSQPLQEHGLPAVVHIVLLRAEEHLEPGFWLPHLRRKGHHALQSRLVEPLNERRELLAVLFESTDNVGLAVKGLLLELSLLHARAEYREVDTLDLLAVQLDLPRRADREVPDHFADPHHSRRRL